MFILALFTDFDDWRQSTGRPDVGKQQITDEEGSDGWCGSCPAVKRRVVVLSRHFSLNIEPSKFDERSENCWTTSSLPLDLSSCFFVLFSFFFLSIVWCFLSHRRLWTRRTSRSPPYRINNHVQLLAQSWIALFPAFPSTRCASPTVLHPQSEQQRAAAHEHNTLDP